MRVRQVTKWHKYERVEKVEIRIFRFYDKRRSTHKHTQTHACMHMCVCVCVRACICVCMYVNSALVLGFWTTRIHSSRSEVFGNCFALLSSMSSFCHATSIPKADHVNVNKSNLFRSCAHVTRPNVATSCPGKAEVVDMVLSIQCAYGWAQVNIYCISFDSLSVRCILKFEEKNVKNLK